MNILRFMIPKSLSVHISSDSTVRQAVEKMRYHRYAALPVLDPEGRYVGTVRNDEILDLLFDGKLAKRGAEKISVLEALDEDSSRPLLHSASFEELFERVREHNFVPVVDDRGCFIGIILRREVMNFLWNKYKKSEKNTTTVG